MNTGFFYHSDFFGVASCRMVLRFDTVEVWGSSPHGPTIFLDSAMAFLYILQSVTFSSERGLSPFK